MSTIWKIPLAITDVQVVRVPQKSVVLAVHIQQGVPCMWIACDPDFPLEDLTVYTHGTGHTVNENVEVYVGTYQILGGDLVFHVFI